MPEAERLPFTYAIAKPNDSGSERKSAAVLCDRLRVASLQKTTSFIRDHRSPSGRARNSLGTCYSVERKVQRSGGWVV